MKLFFTTLLSLFFLTGILNAQDKFVFDQVTKAKNSHELREVVDLNLVPTKRVSTFSPHAKEAVLEFDKNILQNVIKTKKEYLEISVTGFDNEEIPLALVKTNIFAPGFRVILDNAGTKSVYPLDMESMSFYRGIVKGDENSLVALSMMNGQITGFINSRDHDLGLKSNLNGQNVLLDLEDLDHQDLQCGTLDDGQGYAPEMLKAPRNFRDAGDQVAIFVEVESDVSDWLGGDSLTTIYMTSLFNESAAIYAGDGINTVMSILEINETLEYFTTRGKRQIKPSSASSYLSLFQDAQSATFDGDLAQLVAFNNVGGIAAGFSGLCNSNRDNSMCISGFVTDELFNLQIFAHELGHLFGSRHTHACVWNGNNTAIDGCAGGTEGTCATPPPATNNTGTIMSYCYNSYGLDFEEGFHPQPAAVMQNNVANASCLSSGTGGSSCFDGIQNGDETDVDCGGSCAPCPTCNDGIQNGDETGVDCGGSCPDVCPPVSCDDPTNLVVRNMRKQRGVNSAQLAWSDIADANSYDVRIRTAGTTAWSNFSAFESSLGLEGFGEGVQYEWEVRANCGSDVSNYASCTFTFVARGANVTCGAGSNAASLAANTTETLSISPNPATDNLQVMLENPSNENYTLQILNSIGQKVFQSNMSSDNNQMNLNVAGYETGLYFISVSSKNQRHVQKVIIK